MNDIRIPDWQSRGRGAQTSETGGEHMLGNGEPGVPMSTAI